MEIEEPNTETTTDDREQLKLAMVNYINVSREYDQKNEELKEINARKNGFKTEANKYIEKLEFSNRTFNVNGVSIAHKIKNEYTNYSQKYVHTMIRQFFSEENEDGETDIDPTAERLIEFLLMNRAETTKTSLTIKLT